MWEVFSSITLLFADIILEVFSLCLQAENEHIVITKKNNKNFFINFTSFRKIYFKIVSKHITDFIKKIATFDLLLILVYVIFLIYIND